jgi:oligopeptide transport system ATP-binding protein
MTVDSLDPLRDPKVDGDRAGHLLRVRGLTTRFHVRAGDVHAVDGVSFDLGRGESLGIVGESGSGKTATALSIARLLSPPGEVVAGEIEFAGRDLLRLGAEEMRRLRGRRIGLIFQDPMTSLNPVLTVGQQIAEPIQLHLGLSRKEAADRAAELLGKVGIPGPRSRMRDYPHQFSGGMRQRVMVAIALACEPDLVIADEPTTALDVTVQAQLLELLRSLCDELDAAVILITHDLAVAAALCTRLAVMYAGRIVERGDIDVVFEHPQMPYTSALLSSIPRLDEARRGRLTAIRGAPPDLVGTVAGCRFADRCAHVRDVCRAAEPELSSRAQRHEHIARCWGTETEGWI